MLDVVHCTPITISGLISSQWGRTLQVGVLVNVSMLCIYRLPSDSKAFVKSDLLPHLEALLAPECSTFDQSMNTSMGKAVSIPGVVKPESRSSEGSVN